ncbi:MAG: hypothetical protein JNN13_13760 [Planctomycetes bacterium]|nr:hypothetical protein [Planctomycetota bacterium]
MNSSGRNPTAGVFVCGIGMATAVGDNAAQTAASVRAGICRYALSGFHDRHYRALKLALLPDHVLPAVPEAAAALTPRQQRLLQLSALAMPAALAALPDGQTTPLFLAGPEELYAQPSPTTAALRAAMLTLGTPKLLATGGALVADGRAGGVSALQAALRSLEQRQPCHALVGGVDSWLDPALLAALERDERVLAEGVMDGFVPGEAAGFLLLANAAARDRWHQAARVRLHEPGLADEPGHRFSTEPCLGEGLSKAIATALASGAGPCATVLSTLNGENFASKEWGAAAIRNSHLLGRDWTMVHPADCFGDIGAAFGPVLIGIAARWLQQRTRTGAYLAWCASERSARGAVCVTADD